MVTMIGTCQEKRSPGLLLSVYCDARIIKLKGRTRLLVIIGDLLKFFSQKSQALHRLLFLILKAWGQKCFKLLVNIYRHLLIPSLKI